MEEYYFLESMTDFFTKFMNICKGKRIKLIHEGGQCEGKLEEFFDVMIVLSTTNGKKKKKVTLSLLPPTFQIEAILTEDEIAKLTDFKRKIEKNRPKCEDIPLENRECRNM